MTDRVLRDATFRVLHVAPEPVIHILYVGCTLCGENWLRVAERDRNALWVRFNDPASEFRDVVNCLGCLIEAGQHFEHHGWTPIRYGPHAWGPCAVCGKYGDESTMDPSSGDTQLCHDCE